MKQEKRPTRRQKIAIKAAGWDPENWFVERDTGAEMVIVNRKSGKAKTIRKAAVG